MRLLIRAAQRSATATREDMLTLAARLMLVLTHTSVLARSVELNWQIKGALKALVKERYGEILDLTKLWAQIRLRSARRREPESPPGCPSSEASAPRGAPSEPGTETGATPSGQAGPPRRHRTRRRPPAVPDLPPKLEQFQALVQLAFAALRPNPEDEAPAAMLDTFAANLWQRLRVFEAVIGQEEERFDAAMQDPGEEPPRDGQDIVDRCYYIAMLLEEDRDLEGMLKGYLRTIHRKVGAFLRERYGPSPELDRFFRQ